MKQLKKSFVEWLAAVEDGGRTPAERERGASCPRSRRVHWLVVGDELPALTEGGQCFGSGGYSGGVWWCSPSGECPVEILSSAAEDSGFITARKHQVRAVRPGIIRHHESDLLREEPFADDIYVIVEEEDDAAAGWASCPATVSKCSASRGGRRGCDLTELPEGSSGCPYAR